MTQKTFSFLTLMLLVLFHGKCALSFYDPTRPPKILFDETKTKELIPFSLTMIVHKHGKKPFAHILRTQGGVSEKIEEGDYVEGFYILKILHNGLIVRDHRGSHHTLRVHNQEIAIKKHT